MGSGVSTMPAPPPNGLSSTERRASSAPSRRSCTRTSSVPASMARPRIETPQYVVTTSGKIVKTSILTSSASQVEQPLGDVDVDDVRRRVMGGDEADGD